MPAGTIPKHEKPVGDASGRSVWEQLRFWVGLWGGGILWTLHFLTIALVAEWGGFSGLDARHVVGISVVAWLIILVTVVASGVGAWVMWVAYATYQQASQPATGQPADEFYDRIGNRRFLAKASWWSSIAFVLIVVVQSVPVLFFL